MTISPTMVATGSPDPALLAEGASPDLASLAGQPVLRIGGWEVALGPADAARIQLAACGQAELLERYGHARVVGNDAGARTAVVVWSPGQSECVYVLDAEYQKATPVGPIAVWLVHLALAEDAPTELAARVLGWASEPVDAMPAGHKAWVPAAEDAASLKGGDHLGFAQVGGCPVAVHKKGLRALVGGKKKAKALSKAASLHWDASPNAVWRFDDAFSGRCVTRCGLPGLEVQSVAVRAAGAFAALSDTHAICGDKAGLQIVALEGDALVVVDALHPGFPGVKWFSMSGDGQGRVVMAEGDRVVLMRWDGQRLLAEGGWRAGSGGSLVSADGGLFAQRYDAARGWHGTRLVSTR